jgi:integron integrase
MLQIPDQLRAQFDALLVQKKIPPRFHSDYRKWLRYYLDFCDKYGFERSKKSSLLDFVRKLKEKGQTGHQEEQASHAISIFHDFYGVAGGHLNDLKVAEQSGKPFLTKSAEIASKNFDWSSLYKGLNAEIKLRHYSPKTLKAYTRWVRYLQGFTRSKDPKSLSPSDVKEFLTSLAVKRKVSASSQNQAFNALLFFFRHILKREFGEVKDVPRAKRKPYIPVVLSREEVDAIIEALSYPYDLVVKLLYGCGLRMSECLNLRVQSLNFDAGVLTVHDGKGKKDRTVPLPESIMAELKAQLQSVANLHEKDIEAKYAGTFLFDLLEQKYKNAARELVWQWLFPAKTLTFVPETKEYRRYHLHETHVQKAIKRAARKCKLTKRVSAHTFRHSFASHLLQANYDIRTIQELLGHSDVRTTMIYTHTVKSRTLKEAKSPLDF